MKTSENSIIVEVGQIENTCFVAMPFDSLFQAYYEQVIRPAVEELGLTCIRGDEIYSRPQIMADIWKCIRTSRLVIAELTGKNPNVFYEVGLAHAIGKPLILLTRNEDDVPFDLKALRYRYYNLNDPRWGDALHGAIQSMVQSVLEQSELSTYLEGIRVEIQLPAPPNKVDTTALRKVVPNLDISGNWEGIFTGNREHEVTLHITQEEERLVATFKVTHYHREVKTIVHEVLVGTIQGTLIHLNGVSYTYIEQGDCKDYALDNFNLELSSDNRKMAGKMSSKYGDGLATFIKIPDKIQF